MVFVDGGKPEKTLGARLRTNNKLNPHVAPGPGIKPRTQRWEANALTTAPSLHPSKVILRKKLDSYKVPSIWNNI